MTLHWSWGLGTACLLAVVIWLNGHHKRSGWLLGAAVQAVNIAYGWGVSGSWQFVFLTIPAGMFLWNWWQHPKRELARRRAAAMLVDVHGTDQVILMTRPTYDNLSAELQAKAPPPGYAKLWPDGRPWLASPIVPPKDNPFRDLGGL